MGKLLYYDAKLYDHTPMDANLFSRICPKFCVQIVFEFGFKNLISPLIAAFCISERAENIKIVISSILVFFGAN